MNLGTINNFINQKKRKGVYSCVNLPMTQSNSLTCLCVHTPYLLLDIRYLLYLLCVYVCSNIFVTELNAT